jgi:hypothetical protein
MTEGKRRIVRAMLDEVESCTAEYEREPSDMNARLLRAVQWNLDTFLEQYGSAIADELKSADTNERKED